MSGQACFSTRDPDPPHPDFLSLSLSHKKALGDSASIGRRNVVEALRHIWKTEKLRGMYKGISLNLIKNPLATAVSFLVNDLVKEVKDKLVLCACQLALFCFDSTLIGFLLSSPFPSIAPRLRWSK